MVAVKGGLRLAEEPEELLPSVIKFEDKHYFPPHQRPYSEELEIQPEEIRCKIPELKGGERIVLNAYGSWEVHHYEDTRRRLGVYSVISVGEENTGDGERKHYVLRENFSFEESDLAARLLSGNTNIIENRVRGLRYIHLDKKGNS